MLRLMLMLLVVGKIYAAPIDEKQNKEIQDLKNQLDQQKNELKKLSKELQPRNSQSSSNNSNPELQQVLKEISETNKKITKLQKSVRDGSKNDLVQDELLKLRSKVSELNDEKDRLEKSNETKTKFWEKGIFDVSGLITFDASSGKNYNDAETSDLTVSSVELALQKSFSSRVEGQIAFKYEEGQTDFGVDQAFVNSSWGENRSILFSAGLKAIPFGVNETRFITDTLIYTMTDLSETLALAEYRWNKLSLGVFGYNGQSQVTSEANAIKSFGAYFDYFNDEKFLGFIERFRFSYLSNIGDVNGFYETLTDGTNGLNETTGTTGSNTLVKNPGAWTIETTLRFKDLSFVAEYFKLNNSFDSTNFSYNGQTADISAFQTDLALTLFENYSVQVGYQESQDALALGTTDARFPEKRYLVGATWGINNYMSLNLEHRIDKDYSSSDSGNGASGSISGSGKHERITTLQWKIVFF